MTNTTTTTIANPSTMVWAVRVRDTYTGMKGDYVEQMNLPADCEAEAKNWAKQFRGEYEAECGFKVTCKLITAAEAYGA